MEWYLTVPQKPLLIFEGTTCYGTVIEHRTGAFDVQRFLDELVHHVRHSGALSSPR